uniref:Uncharacterized protein n=1 Tax=Arundo donax TaxID=35708 RepID=A0A0A8YX40_ARUDO
MWPRSCSAVGLIPYWKFRWVRASIFGIPYVAPPG